MASCSGLIAFLVTVMVGTRSIGDAFMMDCHNIQSQHSFDTEKIMGDWYAVEIVSHTTHVEENTISTVLDVCPVLKLIREDNTTIRLIWNEKKGDIIYKFQQPKPGNAGFWNSVGPQNGTLVRMGGKIFSGTVQVMKAVGTHMVLTFCSRTDDDVYSVLMSRTKRLHPSDVKSVNSMLLRRGLSKGHVKEMCRGAAAPAVPSMGCLASTAIFTLLFLVLQIINNTRY